MVQSNKHFSHYDTLVSVIVPIYNTEKYIFECIESILNQSYSNLEVLLINDGSTDQSLNVCQQFIEDKRIIIFNNQNMGLSKTRQFGIDHCHGEYFVTIDADDYIHKDFIQKMYCAITLGQADVAICNRFDFQNGSMNFVPIIHRNQKSIELTPEIIISSYESLCSDLGLSDSWDKMYRTKFVRESEIVFDLDNKYNGTDLVFNYKLALHCPKIIMIDECLMYHRLLNGSRVHRKNKPLQEGYEIITQKIKNESDKLKYPDKMNEQISIIFNRFILTTILDAINYSLNSYEAVDKIYAIKSRYDEYVKQNESIYRECIKPYSRIENFMYMLMKPHFPLWKIFVIVSYYVSSIRKKQNNLN